jgi:hypothetical protein
MHPWAPSRNALGTMPDRRLIRVERIAGAILVLRGHKAILDSDLAALYGVETRSPSHLVEHQLSALKALRILSHVQEARLTPRLWLSSTCGPTAASARWSPACTEA